MSRWDSTLHLALPHTTMELAPGTRYLYSNIGYAILGASLSRAAGVPYVQWQREHILDPLGMRHTVFEIDRAITADLTRGYAISQDGEFTSTQSDREALSGRGYKVPNGALYTTVDDLSRFVSLQMGPDVMVAVKAHMNPTGSEAGLIEAMNRAEAEFRRLYPQVAFLFLEPDISD